MCRLLLQAISRMELHGFLNPSPKHMGKENPERETTKRV